MVLEIKLDLQHTMLNNVIATCLKLCAISQSLHILKIFLINTRSGIANHLVVLFIYYLFIFRNSYVVFNNIDELIDQQMHSFANLSINIGVPFSSYLHQQKTCTYGIRTKYSGYSACLHVSAMGLIYGSTYGLLLTPVRSVL